MTIESERAIEAAISFEAKKNGFVQVQSGDIKISLTVAGNEMPKEFLSADMAQRYSVVMVAIDTDEQPIKIEAEKPANNNIAQAAMLVKDKAYWSFLEDQYFGTLQECKGHVETAFKNILNIRSKKEVSGGVSAVYFKSHVAEFNQWKG